MPENTEHLAPRGINYDGPDPSVECGYGPCSNRLRQFEVVGYGPQWCSPEHRLATLNDTVPVYRVRLVICEKCLAGEGDECHVPECAFCFRPVPKGELLEVLNG